MSNASTPSGPPSTTPNAVPTAVRRRPQASAFMNRKKPVVKKPVPKPAQSTTASTAKQTTPNGTATSAAPGPSSESSTPYRDYPIYVTKGELMQGLRHHVMKFLPKQDSYTRTTVTVNPYDEAQYTRPVHLHRRMARDKAAVVEPADVPGVDDKEREALAIKREQREQEREATRAQIAPGANDNKPVKRKNKHSPYVPYYNENDPVAVKRAKLRHEEARPWHLEDFDKKNIWVGSYEEPLSEQTAMFIVTGDGFQMVPCERWYKFIPTNKVQKIDMDLVEKHMTRKVKPDRWMLKTQEAKNEQRRREHEAKMEEMRAQGKAMPVDDEDLNSAVKTGSGAFRGDVDEIDFEFDDEFQDDDEGNLFANEDDEDSKEIAERLRREHLNANLPATGMKDDDKDYDLEEQMEKEAERQEKKRAKKLRKQLIKKERKYEYDSDSEHPYSSSEDSEDSEEEKQRQEEERKREEAKKAVNGERSGTSTKGTNTPTGRSEKRDQSRNNASLGASLKRPGSPGLSDASGTEGRKRAKTNRRAASPNGSGSLSPNAPRGAGSGSDTDTASRSGRPRIRIRASPSASPRGGTPQASRSGSPDVANTGASATAGSMPTPDELKAAVPSGGIGTGELMKRFKARLPTKEARDAFFALVRKTCNWDRERKLILPKPLEA